MPPICAATWIGKSPSRAFNGVTVAPINRGAENLIRPPTGRTESPDSIISTAAAAEFRSEHPLGRAIVAYARARDGPISEPERFAYIPGEGISATVDDNSILVGNRSLMASQNIEVPEALAAAFDSASEIYVAHSN